MNIEEIIRDESSTVYKVLNIPDYKIYYIIDHPKKNLFCYNPRTNVLTYGGDFSVRITPIEKILEELSNMEITQSIHKVINLLIQNK